MSGLIAFFVIMVVILGSALVIYAQIIKESHTRASKAELETKSPMLTSSVKTKNVRELLSQADIGTLWIINHHDGGRHTYEILVRGVLSAEHLDNLQNQDVDEFQRRNPAHRRTFMAALNGADGVLAKLADGEDIGWAGAELIRRCNEWGIYPGGIKAAFGSVIAGRPQIPGSTGTNAAMTRLNFILEPSKGIPAQIQRRDSQFFRPLA